MAPPRLIDISVTSGKALSLADSSCRNPPRLIDISVTSGAVVVEPMIPDVYSALREHPEGKPAGWLVRLRPAVANVLISHGLLLSERSRLFAVTSPLAAFQF
jgi:hypothetical protein